ncbi:hypothetical protein ACG7TL_007229 [Trametes sanguinea]
MRDDSGDDVASDTESGPPSDSSSAGSGGRSKRRRRKRTKKPILKPEKPTPYDGQPDAQIFHKFMRQMTEYIMGHTISRTMYASTVSNFLTGSAYSFWENTVSKRPRRWKLQPLFRQLFNYCFPADYRLQKREELRSCRQGTRSVREFIHELETLFLTVGVVSKREKIDKLWNRLNLYIQRELWKKQLSPTDASWSEVRSWAERIEIAERLGQRAGRSGGGASERRQEHTGAARVYDRPPNSRNRANLSRASRLPLPRPAQGSSTFRPRFGDDHKVRAARARVRSRIKPKQDPE